MTREEELDREIDIIMSAYYEVYPKRIGDVCELYCHGDLVARYINCGQLTDNFIKALVGLAKQDCLEGYDFFEKEEDGQALFDEWVEEGIWDEDEDNYCSWLGQKV